MTTAIEILDQRDVKYSSYYITIALSGGTVTNAEHPIPGLTVDGYGLTLTQKRAARLQMFKGRTSISELTFTLDNHNDQAKALVAQEVTKGLVTVYGGYRDLALAEWRQLPVGYISDFKLNRDGSYTVHVREHKSRMAARIFDIPWAKSHILGNISSSATTITLSYGGGDSLDHQTNHGWMISPLVSDLQFPGGQYVAMDSEIMELTGYTGTSQITVSRGKLGTQAVSHPTQTDVYELMVFQGNPQELMLWLLETGSYGTNGTWDLGIPGWGFDTAAGLLDEQSFLDYIAGDVPQYQMTDFEFWLMGPEDGLAFLEDELLQMTLGHLVESAAGVTRYRVFDIPPSGGWSLSDPLNEMEIIGMPSYKYSTQELYNRIDYGFHYDPITGNYGVESTYSAPISIDYYNRESKLQLRSRGLRLTNAGLDNKAYSYLLDLMQRIFDQSLQGFPAAQVELQMSRQMLEPGEIVPLSHRTVPNLLNATELDENALFTGADIDYRKGRMKAGFLFPDFPRRFMLDTQVLGTYSTAQTLNKSADNSNTYEPASDVLYSYGYPAWGAYMNSDWMTVEFEITTVQTGSVDLAIRYQETLNGDSIAYMTFTLPYDRTGIIYHIVFPNFREGQQLLKFDWFDTSGFEPQALTINSIVYRNDDYIHTPPA